MNKNLYFYKSAISDACELDGWSIRFNLQISREILAEQVANHATPDSRINILSVPSNSNPITQYKTIGLQIYIQEMNLIVRYRISEKEYRCVITVPDHQAWTTFQVYYHQSAGLRLLIDDTDPMSDGFKSEDSGRDVLDDNFVLETLEYEKLQIGDNSSLNFEILIDEVEFGPGFIWSERLQTAHDIGVENITMLGFTKIEGVNLNSVFIRSNDEFYGSAEYSEIHNFSGSAEYSGSGFHSGSGDHSDTNSTQILTKFDSNFDFATVYFDQISETDKDLLSPNQLASTKNELNFYVPPQNYSGRPTEIACLVANATDITNYKIVNSENDYFGSSADTCAIKCNSEYFLVTVSSCVCDFKFFVGMNVSDDPFLCKKCHGLGCPIDDSGFMLFEYEPRFYKVLPSHLRLRSFGGPYSGLKQV